MWGSAGIEMGLAGCTRWSVGAVFFSFRETVVTLAWRERGGVPVSVARKVGKIWPKHELHLSLPTRQILSRYV